MNSLLSFLLGIAIGWFGGKYVDFKGLKEDWKNDFRPKPKSKQSSVVEYKIKGIPEPMEYQQYY